MTNVFLSYRRDDAGGHAGRLCDRLIARFGAARVFMDVQDIEPGQNFEQAIEQTLAKCDVMAVVVGPRWVDIMAARAESGEDFVRHEIAIALHRQMTVIPVVMGGASMPSREQLPSELSAFGRCQAVEIRDDRFDEDAARLVSFLAGPAEPSGVSILGARLSTRAAAAAVATLAVGLLAGWLIWRSPAPHDQRESPAAAGRVGREASFDGDWIAELKKPGQPPFHIRFTLARAGDEVIGVVSYPTGEGTILDGRYSDGTLTFRTSHVPQFESTPATIRIQARLDGDLIRLTTSDDNGVATGVARRSRSLPDLSYGTWTLRKARDEAQKDWSNSVLQFTSQEETPDGLNLHGRFTWRLGNALMGTEDVSGRYVERTRQVILEGSVVSEATHEGPEQLAVGSYSAVLGADERTLTNGRWGSTAANEPGFAGEWEAVR